MGPCSSEQRSFWLQSPGLLEASRADARGPEPRILWDFGDRPKDQTLLADPPPPQGMAVLPGGHFVATACPREIRGWAVSPALRSCASMHTLLLLYSYQDSVADATQ